MFYIRQPRCLYSRYSEPMYYIGYKSKLASCVREFRAFGCDSIGLRIMYSLRVKHRINRTGRAVNHMGSIELYMAD